MNKLSAVLIIGILAAASSVSAIDSGALMGKWAAGGRTYAYVYEFHFTGAAEKRVIMESDTVVWTGTGSYSVKGNTLTVKLEWTASNTPESEIFTIESCDGTKLVLRGKGRYFTDIDSDKVEFMRIPD